MREPALVSALALISNFTTSFPITHAVPILSSAHLCLNSRPSPQEHLSYSLAASERFLGNSITSETKWPLIHSPEYIYIQGGGFLSILVPHPHHDNIEHTLSPSFVTSNSYPSLASPLRFLKHVSTHPRHRHFLKRQAEFQLVPIYLILQRQARQTEASHNFKSQRFLLDSTL